MLILKGLRGYFYIFGRGLTLHEREKARQWLVSAFVWGLCPKLLLDRSFRDKKLGAGDLLD